MQPEFYQPNETRTIEMILLLICLLLVCVIVVLLVKLSEAGTQIRYHQAEIESFRNFNALRQTTSNSTQEVDGNPLPVR